MITAGRPTPILYTPAGASLQNGLVSYWTFEDGSNLGLDSLGANNLVTSGATSVAGLVGLGAHFTRASSQILVQPSGSVSSLSFAGNVSFAVNCWVKFDSLSGSQHNLVIHSTTTNGNGQYKLLRVNPSSGAFLFQTTANGVVFTTVNSGITPVTGLWYCVFGWRDATVGKIFVEVFPGNESGPVSQTASGPFAASAPFVLGGNFPTSGGELLDGTLDLVGVWNRTLTYRERQAIYNTGHGRQYPFR